MIPAQPALIYNYYMLLAVTRVKHTGVLAIDNSLRLIFGSWNLDIHSLISLHMDFNYANSMDFTIDIST